MNKLGQVVELARKTCERHGSYMVHALSVGGRDMETDCPTCAAERLQAAGYEAAKARRIQQAADVRERRLKPAKKFEPPPRYVDSTFETYRPVCEGAKKAERLCYAYAHKYPKVLASGTSLVLTGSTGTGKRISQYRWPAWWHSRATR